MSMADDIIDGMFDEVTGEYLGDPGGFPRTLYRQKSKSGTPPRTDKCPYCGKMCCAGGLSLRRHIKAKHPEEAETPSIEE